MGGRGSDNMTVIIVLFLHNRSYKELSARCASIPNDMRTDSNLVQRLVPSEDDVIEQESSDEDKENDKVESEKVSTDRETCKDGTVVKDAENASKTTADDKKTEVENESTLDLK